MISSCRMKRIIRLLREVLCTGCEIMSRHEDDDVQRDDVLLVVCAWSPGSEQ